MNTVVFNSLTGPIPLTFTISCYYAQYLARGASDLLTEPEVKQLSFKIERTGATTLLGHLSIAGKSKYLKADKTLKAIVPSTLFGKCAEWTMRVEPNLVQPGWNTTSCSTRTFYIDREDIPRFIELFRNQPRLSEKRAKQRQIICTIIPDKKLIGFLVCKEK